MVKQSKNEIETPAGPNALPDIGTRLAFKRTFVAHERTQLAWVRTGLGLISFGFGIAKLFQYLHGQRGQPAPVMGAYTVWMLMIAVAVAGYRLRMCSTGEL